MATKTKKKPTAQDAWTSLYGPGGALGPTGLLNKIKPWTPWVQPTEAPQGSYDPQLDAQGDTQKNTSQWATDDFGLGNLRGQQDYDTAVAQSGQTHGYNLADLQTAQDRGLQDFNRSTADLGTSYQRLGSSQAQSANAAGAGHGGALVAAAAARAGNQAHDQAGLQQTYDRNLADITRSRDRENTGYNQGLEGLQRTFERGRDDRVLGQDRNITSTADFLSGLGKQKVYSAVQGGGWLPTRPSDEHVTAKGTAYREVRHNGVVYHQLANGQLLPLRKAKK